MVVFSGINNASDSGGRIGEEEDDFSYDLRLARRWKRRRIANGNFGLNSCSNKDLKKTSGQNDKNKNAFVESLTVDSEYGKFLNAKLVDLGCGEFVNDMEEFVDFDGGCESHGPADDSGDNVRDIFDPDYMMFLDNLKEDGKSYVLEFALDEILVSVKYEKKDDMNNELEVENGETRKCHSEQRRIRTENVLKSSLERERNETARSVLRSDTRRQHTVSPRINCTSNGNSWNRKAENPRTLRSNSRREENKSSSILHDRLKREKVDSARPLRGDLKRESTRSQKNLREPVVEKNAQKEAEDSVSSAKNGRSTKQRSQGASNCANHQWNHVKSDLVDESYLEFLKLVKDGQHLECTPEGGKKVIYEDSDSSSELGMEKEAEDPVSFAENGCSSRRHGPEATNSVKHQGNPGVKSDLVDESYEKFLKSLKDGQSLEWISDGGKKVVYDEGDSDSEVTILENNPFSDGKHIPIVCIISCCRFIIFFFNFCFYFLKYQFCMFKFLNLVLFWLSVLFLLFHKRKG